MNPLNEFIAQKISDRTKSNSLRKLSIVPPDFIDFCSNDYLGFARKNNAAQNNYGHGSTGSRLISGNREETHLLEKKLADFHGAEAALLFNSGYDANLGLLSALGHRNMVYLYDEFCHASIVDGIRLSLAAGKYHFSHNDSGSLQRLLEKNKNKTLCIVVESLYSMDGDIAPLKEYVQLAKEYNAALIVDEAHAAGIFGKRGEGIVQELGVEKDVFARVVTFGKALGCHGAAVLGNEKVILFLQNFARSFVYTTCLPLQSVESITQSYRLLESGVQEPSALKKRVEYFIQKRKSSKGKWLRSETQIQGLICGDNTKTKSIAEKLYQNKIHVYPVLSPTVPLGSERLRICIHSYNQENEIDALMEIIEGEI